MGAQRDHRAIARIAAAQHGNITTHQLRNVGVTRRVQDRLVEGGWLIPRHRAVYAVGHVPRARESRWLAAVLALGDEAVLSHRSAAALWAILSGPVPTELTVPQRCGIRNRDGLLVHRKPLPEAHVTSRDGIPVTSLLRTVLDLATVLPLRRLANAFEQAQVLHHLPPEPLAAEVLCRRGYRGNARLRRILSGAVDPARVRSILELRFLRMCDAQGIPRPLVNEPIGRWTLDFFWPEFGLVVETDGHAFHRTAAAQRRDALKDRELGRLGLDVVRLTWADVVEGPQLAPLATLKRGASGPRHRAVAAPSGARATVRHA